MFKSKDIKKFDNDPILTDEMKEKIANKIYALDFSEFNDPDKRIASIFFPSTENLLKFVNDEYILEVMIKFTNLEGGLKICPQSNLLRTFDPNKSFCLIILVDFPKKKKGSSLYQSVSCYTL